MINHDRLFKELISTFFMEFIDLFLPSVRSYIDEGSLEFLDKEIFTDVTAGERHEVDLLAKVRFKDEDAFFLIHVENQAQIQTDYARRMFGYFSRLHQKHAMPVYPIALFTFDNPVAEQPDEYGVEFPDQPVLLFQFRRIQLNRLNWRDFAKRDNPVASALMAKMNIAPGERARVKLECLRLLASLRLNTAKTHLILGFVDTYLSLSEEEKQEYTMEVEKLEPQEKEAVTSVRTTWWDDAMHEGMKAGLEKGRQRLITLLIHQTEKRFGPVDASIKNRISSLDSDKAEELGEKLFDFENVEDLQQWLEAGRIS